MAENYYHTKMDIKISPEEKQARMRRRLFTWLVFVIAAIGGLALILFLLSDRIESSRLRFAKVERGDLRTAVTANGKVVPAYEEIIVSPVATRIREVYVNPGDSVEAGSPLLRLDLDNTETDYARQADETAMKRYDMEQASLTSSTTISNLEMQIEAKEMAVDRLYATYLNERRLDSIGSGTGERIREAELAYKTGQLELRQLRAQLANQKKIESAAASRRRLESDISLRNLALAQRTLDQARILAPLRGTVTWLNTTLGATVGAGEKVAVISDLSRFKVEAELAEGHGDKLTVGGPVTVQLGKNEQTGRILTTNAQTNSGMLSFTVALDSAAAPGLRPGMTARVGVIYDERPDVLRIPMGAYYEGPGEYELFVREGDEIRKRKLLLGDSDTHWVEVRSGIEEGEEVVVSDCSRYTSRSYRLK